MYSDHKNIFAKRKYSFVRGSMLFTAGIIFYHSGINQQIRLDQNNILIIEIFSAIIMFTGGFVFFYGTEALRNALFPFLFLVFMIPIPADVFEKIIYCLNVGTAESSYAFLKLIGVPVFRDVLILHLPNVSVEVVKQCSGIRSSMVILILGVMMGQIYLKSWWKKIILIISIIPLVILKNGIRVVTLTLLGNYVDITFLTNSKLHKSGGIVFVIPIVIFLMVILWFLKKAEKGIANM